MGKKSRTFSSQQEEKMQNLSRTWERNQGLSPHSKKKRCKICQDHEKERQHSQVQSAMQSILVHVESQRQRKGCQVETVAPTWIVGQGYWKVLKMSQARSFRILQFFLYCVDFHEYQG